MLNTIKNKIPLFYTILKLKEDCTKKYTLRNIIYFTECMVFLLNRSVQCTVLKCTVLYITVLYSSTVPACTIYYSTPLHYTEHHPI